MTPPRWRREKLFLLIGLLFLTSALSLKALKTPNSLSFSGLPDLSSNFSSDGGRLSSSKTEVQNRTTLADSELRTDKKTTASSSSEVELVQEDSLPEKIIIPKAKVDLPVSGAKVVDNHWEIFPDRASYLFGSGLPGREGNTVIYAHNKSHLFGPIRWLEKDDEVKIVNQREEEFVYRVTEIKKVSPETVEVLLPTKDTTLTLYTCTGFLDRERFVVVGKLL